MRSAPAPRYPANYVYTPDFLARTPAFTPPVCLLPPLRALPPGFLS